MLRWIAALSLVFMLVGCAQKPIRLEAGKAELKGPHIATTQPASGGAYVTGFVKNGDCVIFHTKVHAGLYEAFIGYHADHPKGFSFTAGGASHSGMFPATDQWFARYDAGLIRLPDNGEVVLNKGWGYFDIAYLELVPAKVPEQPARVAPVLTDPQASAEARSLMYYLCRMYGIKTLSGTYGENESAYIKEVTGKVPAILGTDLMEYSPSRIEHGAKPGDLVEKTIAAAKAGQYITVSWHWNAPKDLLDKEIVTDGGQRIDARWYKGFNASATTFDVERALANPDSEDYRLLLRDIDAIAVQLRKFADAKVPVLWRPLHEADGKWFWWGAKGAEPFKKLWILMHERMTKVHGLHNLIWVYTGTENIDWYPGDAYVDVYGIDAYPALNDPLIAQWTALQKHFAGKKLLAISEFGGVPDIQMMRAYGAYWSYFVSWSGDAGPKKHSKDDLIRLYRYWGVINADETIKP